MKQAELFIAGANGQLGSALQATYPDAQKASRAELDITDRDAVLGYDWSGIRHILNAAAYNHVDIAETDEGREQAWKVNAMAVGYLAEVAVKHGITLVHVSTDYVFGSPKCPHTEDEPYSPLSIYGASKAAGDIAASLVPMHYILRPSWVIGEGKNFVRAMMSLAESNTSPSVVHDQVGRLTFTTELVRAMGHLLTNNVDYGIYNVTNSGQAASRADITREIFRCMGRRDLTVTNTTTNEYYADQPDIARRPLQSELDLRKLHDTGFKSREWQKNLAHYVKGEQT